VGKWFGFESNVNRFERTASAVVRIFGLDIDVAAYGYLTDWCFPFMLVPMRWGVFTQVMGVSLFIGRLRNR
jgi:hypothetical protein